MHAGTCGDFGYFWMICLRISIALSSIFAL